MLRTAAVSAKAYFPIENLARERRATAVSELPLLQATLAKSVAKTFSRNGVMWRSHANGRAHSLGDAKHMFSDGAVEVTDGTANYGSASAINPDALPK